MNIGEAVSAAMKNIIAEKSTTMTAIVKSTRISQAAISQIVNGAGSKKTRYPSIFSIHEFCCGTGYTLEEFFARKEFDDLE